MVIASPNSTGYETGEAARRLAEETTAAALQTAERSMAMSRQFVEVWVASTEATLKVAFDLQNTAIAAGRSLIEATGNSNQVVFQQWMDMVRQAQTATLSAWQASQRIGEQFQAPDGKKGPAK